MSLPDAAASAAALAALLAVAAYLVWALPRLSPRLAWVGTAALQVLGAVTLVVHPAAGWVLLPMVALLFGHAGRGLGRRAALALLPVPKAPPAAAESVPVPTQPPPAGRPATLGRYRIDPQIGRRVAVKTLALSREFHGDKLVEARQRFFREAETAGRLQHPDIVTIFDAGEAQDLAYIAMEYIKGHDLQRHAVASRLLPLPQLLAIVARVADALAYAHSQGVVHRDIKPANVMVEPAAGLVKVMDFGVARISDASRTRTGLVLGTPSFMSPEQMAGRHTDGRSDLYSLGVMLFQLITGGLPHQGDSMAKLMHQIAHEPAPDVRSRRPDVPEALANIVALALEKRPEVRYADGHELAEDLRAVAQALKAPTTSDDDPFEKTVTFSRSEPRHNSRP